MFSDILLFFYISFLSHSQKKDLYSLITNNINSTIQIKENTIKNNQKGNQKEKKLNQSIRTIIFKEMLYMLCIINNSKRKNLFHFPSLYKKIDNKCNAPKIFSFKKKNANLK